jgi:MBOAT, membrane-bound O-acyltransferase family
VLHEAAGFGTCGLLRHGHNAHSLFIAFWLDANLFSLSSSWKLLQDEALRPVAANLGMELSLIKYTASMFLVYPLAALLRALPNASSKHVFSLVVGVAMVQWVFEGDWIHTFASSAGTYLICALAPKKMTGPLAFVWVMFYMTMSHWYRMYMSFMSGMFDFTGTQMVLTMKLTSFAWNYWDGTADYKRIFSDADSKSSEKNRERRRLAITTLPNPIEYFGYVYCFTCILAGPSFEYRDYMDGITGSTLIFKGSDDKVIGDKDSKIPVNAAPSPVPSALISLSVGVVYLVLKLVMGGYFPLATYKDISNPGVPYNMVPTLSNPEWLDAHPNVVWRFLLVMLTLQAERYKYYFAWKVAEGSCQLAGFGFQGFDSQGSALGWRGMENIDIWGFETSWNIQTMTRAWNKRTQKWLDLYTYQRTGGSLLATYFVSAFWHGLYPGYYFFFLLVPLITQIERLTRVKLNPIFIPGYDFKRPHETYPYNAAGIAYVILGWLSFFPLMNYVTQVFAVGTMENTLRAFKSYNYCGHIAIVVAYVALAIMPTTTVKKEKRM